MLSVCRGLLIAHADWELIGAWNLMGFRPYAGVHNLVFSRGNGADVTVPVDLKL